MQAGGAEHPDSTLIEINLGDPEAPVYPAILPIYRYTNLEYKYTC